MKKYRILKFIPIAFVPLTLYRFVKMYFNSIFILKKMIEMSDENMRPEFAKKKKIEYHLKR